MRTLLERSVASNNLKARDVCDSILNHEGLRHDRNSAFWLTAFGLERRIIGGVDYKGVREIMKTCIDKVQTLPTEAIETSMSAQLAAIQNLLSYIFDRNAALLPGYFIVNEILKSYPDNPSWPHWAIVPMVSSFLNSFRPMAQMVTCINRHRMRPIVEMTGKAHLVSTWKLDPNSLKFYLKGSLTYERTLPYAKEITGSQKELLRYILRQSYSKELVSSVLGLQKPRKETGLSAGSGGGAQRYAALEEQLVCLFVSAMSESDELLWRNLSSELIFFILFQYVSFPSFVGALTEKCRELQQVIT
jgi:mediator of RNA polymerase II transcription subunit 23